MTPAEILNALGQRLAGMTDCPQIVWENKSTVPASLPYLTAAVVPGVTADRSLSGGAEWSDGTFVVVVVSELNKFTTAANILAANIKARFPYGLRPTAGLIIPAPPRVVKGYPTDADWRVPVQIPWKTMN